MSNYLLETYMDSDLPTDYHGSVLKLARELIEYEQRLSVELVGKRRQISSAESIEQFLVKTSLITLAVLPNGHVVGFCTFWHEPVLGRLVIDTVYVTPEYRQRGIAKSLLGIPLKTNHSFVDIAVMVNNEPALKLYASFGFKPYITTMTKVD